MSFLKNLLIGSAIAGIGMYSLMKNKKKPIVMNNYSSSKPTMMVMGDVKNKDAFAKYVSRVQEDTINSNIVVEKKTPNIDYSLTTNYDSKTEVIKSGLEAKTNENITLGLKGNHDKNSYSGEVTAKKEIKIGWLSRIVNSIGLFGSYDKNKKESAGLEVKLFNNDTYRLDVKNFFSNQPLRFNAYKVA